MKRIILSILLLLLSLHVYSKSFMDYFYRIDGFYNNAKFIDENKLVLVGSSGNVLFSLNKGMTWYSNYTGTSETLLDCDVEPNTNTLFCVGENGTIIKTSDLGNNWESVGINNSFSFNSIIFSSNFGFIATSTGKIYKSTNNGLSWTEYKSISTNPLSFIKILKDSTIIAIDNKSGIYISKDEGINWKGINTNNELVKGMYGGLSIKDAMICVFTSNGLLISYDNGINWILKEIGNKDIFGLSILDKKNVRIFCRIPNDGSIYRYFDMFDVNFENEIKVTKVENILDKNYLLFQSYPIGLASNEFSKEGESIVFGTFNSILMSYDKLQTWQAKSYYRSTSYPNLFVLNSDTLFAGTGNNLIFHSFNGGATWLPQKDSNGLVNPYLINSLFFNDGMNGIAFQFNGESKLFTNNGGLTFDTISQKRIQPLVASIKDMNSYCLVSNRQSSKTQYTEINVTTDGGSNFNETLLEYKDYPISISKFNFLKNGEIKSLASIVDSVYRDPNDISKVKTYYSYYYLSSSNFGKTWNWELIKDLNEPYDLNIINDTLAFIKTRIIEDSVTIHYFLNKSVDNLKTWKVVLETPISLNSLSINTLKQLEKGKSITIGSQGDLYQTANFGDTWELMVDNMYPNINTGKLFSSEKDYYITTMRAGLYKSKPNIFDFITDVKEKNTVTSKSNFSISPNPASDYIYINVGVRHALPLDESIEIFNIFGESVSTTPPFGHPFINEGEKIKIDISNLTPGVYFIRIGDRFEKFIKI